MDAPSKGTLPPVRIERDRFGPLELPSSCLYGIGTARCLENLSFSNSKLSDYPDFLNALLSVKRACAQANLASGLIANEIQHAIDNACLKLAHADHRQSFPVDMLHGGGGIAFNLNVNEAVANYANLQSMGAAGVYFPVHPAKHVNLCQSTADVCHTSLRLAIVVAARRLDMALESLSDAFARKSAEFRPIKTLARTCLQDAMTVSLGAAFGAFDTVTARRRKEFASSVDQLKKVNLGGTVIGSGEGANSRYREQVINSLAEVTAITFTQRENLFDAAQNSDDIGNASAQLRLLAQSLIKTCKDLRLLSSGPNGGFGEITLPALQDGSSFFQGKVNPVVPETVIQACMQVLGTDTTIQAAIEHGELNLNIFEPAMAKNMLDAIQMLSAAISLLSEKCISGITANKERCSQLVEFAQPFGAQTVSNRV